MATINLEILKQLLEEFSEKDALASAEIGVIEQEVINLEGRIETCRAKLKNLSEDKEKLAAIQERYSGGKFDAPSVKELRTDVNKRITSSASVSQSMAISQSISKSMESKTEPMVEHTGEEKATIGQSSEPATGSVRAKGHKPGKQEESDLLPEAEETTPESKAEPENKVEQPDTASNQGSGDTIKSINDALKGLFRK